MLSFLILHNNELFFDWIVMCIEKWILYDNLRCPARIGLRRSSKALPKTKITPKKKKTLMFSLVVCWQSDSQLSESCKTCYIWEICWANWWDALRNAMPAASVGQQNGPSSSQHLTAHHPTKASKVEQIGLQSYASSAIFTWPLVNQLPLLQASQQLFAGEMFPQPTGDRKCFPRVHRILKHGFLCYKSKQIYFSSATMCGL